MWKDKKCNTCEFCIISKYSYLGFESERGYCRLNPPKYPEVRAKYRDSYGNIWDWTSDSCSKYIETY